MKIIEGILSDIPSKPSTGFVAVLAKHRSELDPNFNLRSGIARAKLYALARAIIEALGGKKGDGGWELEFSADDRVAALEANVAALEAKASNESAVKLLEFQRAEDLALIQALTERVEKLEQAPKRGPKPEKHDPKPAPEAPQTQAQ